MGTGYYIIFIMALIMLTYSITLISLYAKGDITFDPNHTDFMWLTAALECDERTTCRCRDVCGAHGPKRIFAAPDDLGEETAQTY